MDRSSFDFRRFSALPDTVAAFVPAELMFGFLTRSLDLPAGWCAMVTREVGDDVVVPDGARVSGDGVTEVLFARTTPMDITLRETELKSSDGYIFDGTIRIIVAVVAERSELHSFRDNVLGSRTAVRVGEIEQTLRWPVRQALTQFAESKTADALSKIDGGAFRAVLEKSLEPVLFTTGLALAGVGEVSFASAAYSRTRAEAERAAQAADVNATRSQLEAAMRQSRSEQLSHLGELLAKVRDLAETSPGVNIGDLIQTFSERDRAQVYEALWTVLPPRERTAAVVAAVGDELLFYDPARSDRPTRRVQLAGPAGMLRSVSVVRDAGKLKLLVGAARGVYLIGTDENEPSETYVFDDSVGDTRGGVNSVALTDDRAYATHSEVGLVSWGRTADAQMQRLLEPLTKGARVVRHAQIHGGELWFSVNDKIVSVPIDAPSPEMAEIRSVGKSYVSSLKPSVRGVYAGTDDGRVLYWRNGETEQPKQIASGRDEPVESIECRLLGGVDRIVFTDSSQGVKSRILGDAYQCQYGGAYMPIRRCEVAEDLIAGLSENRDRIFTWAPPEPAAPSAMLPVGSQTGRTVQDIALVPVA